MKKEHKNTIEQIVVGLISALSVMGLFYYLFFHSFIHDRIVQLCEMIQLIINYNNITMSAYLSKNEYANMKLVPGLLCSGGAIGSYMIYDSYTGFSAFLTGMLFVPMAIVLAYFGLINLMKYFLWQLSFSL